MNMEETSSVRIEQPSSRKCSFFTWFQRIFTLDAVTNRKQHFPLFILIMSSLQIIIFLLTYTYVDEERHGFISILYSLGRLYLPCIRPTIRDTRLRIVYCQPFIEGDMCYYDDIVKHECFSFAYPYQFWRLISVAFFHSNWLHLISNLSAQLIQGIPLERKYGTCRTLAIYWICGLGASLLGLIRLRDQGAVGASGCLYGLMFFLIVDRILAASTSDGCSRGFVIVQLFLLLLPYILTSVFLTIHYNVLHDAHVGGGLVGLLLGIQMLGCPSKCLCKDNDKCQKIFRCLALALLILYFLITLINLLLSDAPIAEKIRNDRIQYNNTIITVNLE